MSDKCIACQFVKKTVEVRFWGQEMWIMEGGRLAKDRIEYVVCVGYLLEHILKLREVVAFYGISVWKVLYFILDGFINN